MKAIRRDSRQRVVDTMSVKVSRVGDKVFLTTTSDDGVRGAREYVFTVEEWEAVRNA